MGSGKMQPTFRRSNIGDFDLLEVKQPQTSQRRADAEYAGQLVLERDASTVCSKDFERFDAAGESFVVLEKPRHLLQRLGGSDGDVAK